MAGKRPAKDPLADLRQDDGERYPAPDPIDDDENANPGLEALILERLEAAMTIPLDKDGNLSGASREMAQAMATELATELAPVVAQVADPDEAVTRWHADTTAVGFLHRGGRCGCRYLARVILGA